MHLTPHVVIYLRVRVLNWPWKQDKDVICAVEWASCQSRNGNRNLVFGGLSWQAPHWPSLSLSVIDNPAAPNDLSLRTSLAPGQRTTFHRYRGNPRTTHRAEWGTSTQYRWYEKHPSTLRKEINTQEIGELVSAGSYGVVQTRVHHLGKGHRELLTRIVTLW